MLTLRRPLTLRFSARSHRMEQYCDAQREEDIPSGQHGFFECLVRAQLAIRRFDKLDDRRELGWIRFRCNRAERLGW